MRFVSIRDLRNTPSTVWSALDDEDLVLTSNGGPVAVLVRVDAGDVDSTLELIRRMRAQQAVSRLRQQAARAGTAALTDDEVEREIEVSRREQPRA
jgi:antitoxin (DNA-binding transcriptional repressor) of toxin-antitoxin stability system